MKSCGIKTMLSGGERVDIRRFRVFTFDWSMTNGHRLLTEVPEEVVESHWDVKREALVRVVKICVGQIANQRRQKDENSE